eukprot:Rmarinus@m.14471
MADGISLLQLTPFAQSAATHLSRETDVFLFMRNPSPHVSELLSLRPNFHAIDFSRPVNSTPNTYRFHLYAEFLRAHGFRYSHVLLCDVTDVIFVSDPFATGPHHDLSFYLESEAHTLGNSAWNAGWIQDYFGAKVLQSVSEKRISCSGVVFGRPTAVHHYSRKVAEMCLQHAHDQPCHNVLLYSGGVDVMLYDHANGTVLHQALELPVPSNWRSIKGEIVNSKGGAVSIVHQWDRKAWVVREVLNSPIAESARLFLSTAADKCGLNVPMISDELNESDGIPSKFSSKHIYIAAGEETAKLGYLLTSLVSLRKSGDLKSPIFYFLSENRTVAYEESLLLRWLNVIVVRRKWDTSFDAAVSTFLKQTDRDKFRGTCFILLRDLAVVRFQKGTWDICVQPYSPLVEYPPAVSSIQAYTTEETSKLYSSVFYTSWIMRILGPDFWSLSGCPLTTPDLVTGSLSGIQMYSQSVADVVESPLLRNPRFPDSNIVDNRGNPYFPLESAATSSLAHAFVICAFSASSLSTKSLSHSYSKFDEKQLDSMNFAASFLQTEILLSDGLAYSPQTDIVGNVVNSPQQRHRPSGVHVFPFRPVTETDFYVSSNHDVGTPVGSPVAAVVRWGEDYNYVRAVMKQDAALSCDVLRIISSESNLCTTL